MGSPKRYSARAEAVRCSDETISRMRAGETLSAIHDDLTERREITMALRTFMQWMRRLENDSPYVPLSKSASTSKMHERSSEHTNSHHSGSHSVVSGDCGRSKSATRLQDSASTAGGSTRDGNETKEPKRIRMGTPIPPPLNTEPDNVALFGEDQ